MKKKLLALLCLMLACTMVFAACGSDSTSSSTASTGSDDASTTTDESTGGDAEADGDSDGDTAESTGLVFGWSVYDNTQEFFQSMTSGVTAKAAELGIEIIEHDQQNSESEMISGATRLIDEYNVDALIISPCKPESLGTIVELAQQKGIPVVICDIGDGGTDKDVIIVSDMYAGGEMAGNYALQLLEEEGVEGKDYAVIRCEASAVYAARRPEGFKDVMNAAGYNMVQELTADSDQSLGYQAMQDILQANPDIVAVFAANDPMALGAMEALLDADRTDILVFGFNGDDAALEAIAAGTMHGTVAQDPAGIGALGVELAEVLANGGTLTYDEPDTKEIFADVSMIGKDGTVVS